MGKRKIGMLIIAGFLFIIILFKTCGWRVPLLGLDAFEAVPERCALVFEIKEPLENVKTWEKKWRSKGLNQFDFFKSLTTDFELIQSFFETIPEPTLKGARLLACVNPGASTALGYTYILEPGEDALDLDLFLQNEKVKSTKIYNFKGHELYEVSLKEGEKVSLAKFRNLIVIGRLALQVEEALTQLYQPEKSLTRAKAFRQLGESGEAVDVVMFINFAQFSTAFSAYIKPEKRKELAWLQDYFHWLRFDFDFENESFFSDSKLIPNPNSKFFNGVLKQIATDSTRMQEYVPDHATVFFGVGVKNIKNFYKKGRHESNRNFEKYMLSWMDGEVAYVITEPYSTSLLEEKFVVLKAKNIKEAEYWLKTYALKQGDYMMSDYLTFPIHQLQKENFLEPIFGDLFTNINDPYFSILGEYVVFCNSKQALEIWIDKYVAGQTLSRSVHFLEFYINETKLSPLLFYVNTENLLQLLKSYTRKNMLEKMMKMHKGFRQFHTFAMIMEPVGKGFDARAYFNADIKEKKHSSVLWKTKLEAEVVIPPATVLNPTTGQNAILVQDAKNKIYLLNQEGNILWQRELDGRILSEITEVDYYENGQLQYLFNTSKKIYQIDSEGNDVGAFPLRLNSPATNGVLVIDFDENKKYKIYVACKNGNLYGFEKNGAPLPGWNPCKYAGRTTFPLKYFRYENKDYIFGVNDAGKLYAYSRFGERRFNPIRLRKKFYAPPDFQVLENEARIVAGDHEGYAHVVRPNGQHFKLSLGLKNGRNGRFAFSNIVGDERNDYIVLHEDIMAIYCYEEDNFKQVFTHTFDAKQDELFAVDIPRRAKHLIGTYAKDKKQIYLFNGIGEIYPDFPLAGTTRFAVTDLFNDRSRILVVGNKDRVFAYKLR